MGRIIHLSQQRLIRSPRDAEQAACDALKAIGHLDAVVTGAGADNGIDVIASGAVAQVKAEMVKTGRPVVQNLFGIASLKKAKGYVFSLRGFTQNAIDWADQSGVRLFQFDYQGAAQPCNKHATADAQVGTASEPLGTGDDFDPERVLSTLLQHREMTAWLGEEFVWKLGLMQTPDGQFAAITVLRHGFIGVDDSLLFHWEVTDIAAASTCYAETAAAACNAACTELVRLLYAASMELTDMKVAVGPHEPILRGRPVAQDTTDPHSPLDLADARRIAATLLRYSGAFGIVTVPAYSSPLDVDMGRASVASAWALVFNEELAEHSGQGAVVQVLLTWDGISQYINACLTDFYGLIQVNELTQFNETAQQVSFVVSEDTREAAATAAVATTDGMFQRLGFEWSSSFVNVWGGNDGYT